MKVQKLCYFIDIYFYPFLVFLEYFWGRSHLFLVALSRKVGKCINANTEDDSLAFKKKEKRKKLYPRCFCVE